MRSLGRNIMIGAAGGLVATAAMSVVMLVASRLGLTAQLPPGRIAEEAIEAATSRPATRDEEEAVASIAHAAFGVAGGVIFGVIVSSLRRVPSGLMAGLGAVYATSIWLVSYQGWVPALRIMPPASRDDPGRAITMLVAHWVYGAVLGLVFAILRR
ncbi:MAG: DUF6789 family protein [Candidatus Limnocylindria bacterium]